jgi:hypothetical protein
LKIDSVCILTILINGNIDIDYDLTLELVVNEYVKTNIGLHIIYDDDIKAKEEVNGEQVTVGPKTKQTNIRSRIVYNF